MSTGELTCDKGGKEGLERGVVVWEKYQRGGGGRTRYIGVPLLHQRGGY